MRKELVLAVVALVASSVPGIAADQEWQSVRVTNSSADAKDCTLRGNVHAEDLGWVMSGNTRKLLDSLRKEAVELDADTVVMVTGVTTREVSGGRHRLMADGEAYRCSGIAPLPTSSDPALKEILDLEERISAAMLRGDRATLELAFASDAVFHSEGKTQSRSDVLKATQPHPDILKRTLENLDFSHDGDAASLKGTAIWIIRGAQSDKAIKQVFTRRFRMVAGEGWQLIESTTETITP